MSVKRLLSGGLLALLLLLFLLCLSGAQGLMFPPAPGDSCSDNSDCTKGCCLMLGLRHRRPSGVCQAMRQMGEYCAPGNRLRNYYGSRVYTYSCPCNIGLTCKPKWASNLNGRSVMEEPRCLPSDNYPSVLAMKGFGFNRHTIVPAE